MLISEAFSAYAQDVIIFRNQSPKTEENHYVVMKVLVRHFGDIDIDTLTFPMIRDFKVVLDKSRSTTTVRNYIIRLRVVLGYLRMNGHNCLMPDHLPVPKRSETIPDFISKEDVTKLIRAVSKPAAGYEKANRLKNAAMISLLYASGIRVSELCSINRADIKEDGTFTVLGKGSKPRLCFLDERTQWLIDEYLEERSDSNPALFIARQTGNRVNPGGVQMVFRLARDKAGFKTPIHPHTLRHSFATDLLKNNANIRYVQELLGHRSLETTQVYTHVTNVDLQKVYREHHKI
jgi:integrase/recombinase XerD